MHCQYPHQKSPPNAFQTLAIPGSWSSGEALAPALPLPGLHTSHANTHHTPLNRHSDSTSLLLGLVLRTHMHTSACPHCTSELPGSQMSKSAACGLFLTAPSSASTVSMDGSPVSLQRHCLDYQWPGVRRQDRCLTASGWSTGREHRWPTLGDMAGLWP